MYPLVHGLVIDRIPVTVTCPVLKIAPQPHYRGWPTPVTDADRVQAHRANALFDAHRDNPEFGYRVLVDEARLGPVDGRPDSVADLLLERLVVGVRQETWPQRQARVRQAAVTVPVAMSNATNNVVVPCRR